MKGNVYVYIFGMAIVTFLIRATPLLFLRRQIQNRTLRSFLYYVPYVTLAVMTFPAILDATQSTAAAGVALVLAIALALLGCKLFPVTVGACLCVLILEWFLV